MTDQFQFEPADESEQLDQLDPDPAVVDRDTDDAVDDSYAPRDDPSGTEPFAAADAEVAEGVEFEQRLEQDEPEVEDDWDEELDESDETDESDEPGAAP
jgi:hypothetical protein